MRKRLITAVVLGVSCVTANPWNFAIAQTAQASCPTLKQATPSPQKTQAITSKVNKQFKATGVNGAYNLVMMGRYGMAGWYNKSAGTITPMAIMVDGNRVQAHMLNPYSVNRLLKLGYPRRTAECLQQLFNEAGI
ncbi:MAG TPA: hypothetical protein IGS53_08590 [Leptolyngbyaceae cyanobacterium M33_DOE_097]|uniref:Uncharacterized protein n=1 Tax=Oscillatoriales cyanobacterium SpSt-418 TaxID=2282169 RepID=A0A7C3PEP9_9CYAN|nr:hypothetical protein [Leptolyngbyaceae cyanobacterium M33_DOE_097]